MLEKRAAWADVKAKAEAIAATGGVVITRDDSEEVDAVVTSAQRQAPALGQGRLPLAADDGRIDLFGQ